MYFNRNNIPFTPTQIEAIRAGMQPGLTMVRAIPYLYFPLLSHFQSLPVSDCSCRFSVNCSMFIQCQKHDLFESLSCLDVVVTGYQGCFSSKSHHSCKCGRNEDEVNNGCERTSVNEPWCPCWPRSVWTGCWLRGILKLLIGCWQGLLAVIYRAVGW